LTEQINTFAFGQLKANRSMNLVLDIGNTRTKAGWFDRGRLAGSSHFEALTPGILAGIMAREPVDMMMVSSVSESYRDMISEVVIGSGMILFLDHSMPLPLEIDYGSPETLGNDRIAAAAGAWCIMPHVPILVMDLGTAITIDFVSAAGQFTGGNISPGLHTRFSSLHEHTARLPLVEADGRYPEFGTNTRTAIAAGVQQGIIHELNGYISLFEKRYPGCRNVLTGGDAGFFAGKLIKPVPEYPDLVLTGLNYILEFNNGIDRK